MAEPIGDACIQAEIDAAWAAYEGDREPGISDLEWSQHTGRGFVEEFRAAPYGVMRDWQPRVVADDKREAA
jgi:hypothetical protein